jgi:MoaA/NifB/PqqE/SkfB family radical SAM enzyme
MRYRNFLSFSNKVINMMEIKFKKTRLISKPVELIIEPTLQCNSNCVMCNRNFNRKGDKEAKGFLTWDIFNKISPFFKYAENVLFSGFGEPLLHPECVGMISRIKKYNIFVYFFTNAILLSNEFSRKFTDIGIDMICISIGGATRETHMKIRGIDAFETVVNNIRTLTEYKKKTKKTKPLISFNIVAMNSILPELEALLDLAKEIGVEHIAMPNLVVQGKEMGKESIWHSLENAKTAFKKARVLAAKYNIEFNAPWLGIKNMDCKSIFNKMIVTYDGKILSCAMERFIIGDLQKHDISHIWNSDAMIKLRKDYYKLGLEKLCSNCSCWDNRPEIFLNPWLNSREYAEHIK